MPRHRRGTALHCQCHGLPFRRRERPHHRGRDDDAGPGGWPDGTGEHLGALTAAPRAHGRVAAMTRVAGIDCGTNSIRLLVADVDPATGALADVERTMEVVRLGQGVDRTGRLAPEALERALAATRRYAARCAELGVEAIRYVATSATRDAENRREFVDGVRTAIGVEPEVIDGAEEARLSFRGATGVLGSRHAGPLLVVDLGGGSTELVLGTDVPIAAYSMDVGCVRLTERHLYGDPPLSLIHISEPT